MELRRNNPQQILLLYENKAHQESMTHSGQPTVTIMNLLMNDTSCILMMYGLIVVESSQGQVSTCHFQC